MAKTMQSCAILLMMLVGTCWSDLVQDSDLADLRAQISKLGDQIKVAESGEDKAQKLLEDSRATALSFESEIGKLKASLAAKDTQESTLQEQLSLLQNEAKNLREQQSLHSDLAKNFEVVTKELEATKDTLAKTLAQLAEKTSSSNSAEISLSQAQQALKKAEADRDEALKSLSSQDSSTVGLQAELDSKKKKTKALEGEVKALTEEKGKMQYEQDKLQSALSEAQRNLKKSERDAKDSKKEAEDAQALVSRVELQLQKAMKEHSATQAALIQAEAKAQEAAQKVQTLLTAWLPHWLEDRYQQVRHSVDPAVRSLQPYLDSAWKQGKSLSQQSQKHASSAYTLTRSKSIQAWQESKPALLRLWAEIQRLWKLYTKKAVEVAGPQFQVLKAKATTRYKTLHSSASSWLAQNPQIQRLRRSLNRTIRDLEKLAIRYLRKVPALRPYAKTPEVTYLVWAVLLAPLVTILAPLLIFRGEKKKARELETRNVAIGRGGVTPDPRQAKPSAGQKQKKARRISVGEEHVRVP